MIDFLCLNNVDGGNGKAAVFVMVYYIIQNWIHSDLDDHYVPRTNSKTYGDSAFSSAAPHLWNSLPSELRSCNSILGLKKI